MRHIIFVSLALGVLLPYTQGVNAAEQGTVDSTISTIPELPGTPKDSTGTTGTPSSATGVPPSATDAPPSTTDTTNTPPVSSQPSTSLPNAQTPPTAPTSQSGDTVKHFGAIELNGINVDNLDHEGMLRLGNAVINQMLQVNGIADIENSKLNNVLINGSGSFENSVVAGAVTINGQMDSKSSTFDNDVIVEGYLSTQKSAFKKVLTLQGVNTNFTDSTLQDVVVKSSGDPNLNPQLNLIGSKITGNVTFTGGNGTITLDSNSSVTGKVEGGTIQKTQ